MINHGQAFSRMGSGPIKSSPCIKPESLALSAGLSWLFLAIPASITAIVGGGNVTARFLGKYCHANIQIFDHQTFQKVCKKVESE